ncbi:MAG: hypothetical protein Q8P67_07145 [archaeon]|nr:hypothetical protein [archaeon]
MGARSSSSPRTGDICWFSRSLVISPPPSSSSSSSESSSLENA